ncbi:dipeptidyl aminopeptidase/acylaminoacyl peptidase [Saccharopolyspora erythraea NRRL 2338]|uniref:Acyl-peptide hydrolase n=2 Tax=Saccharopolyspora erythraea TaxID=1836 RepID=A4F6C9_SACEN|nr:S9 family peptidase [Saccharopolyspora erythraea]EQD88065.1 peptidase S9 [Saccharopolyspora erythraea D]PFG93408.1 dipeptidyl aminopeptidase/acylaminoacyl peptidase [Saccharopolyspora erythraea NRRL 2338]QRK90283.1 S9 family peptidase [Saccharopolyspora erythraea]CAL99603.1 peptidase S9, prolyl oligopeptidase active site region [Saccharopolyspora erythraea NRRL 2338]
MRLDIVRLLGCTSRRAFDVDDSGRVLAGSDESGSVQLAEIAGGEVSALTALPGAVSGRYLPGERAVVVQHDTDGDERSQLSLLTLDVPRTGPATMRDLRPLVHDSRYVHRLLDVLPGRVVYATNRRNGVDFDVVVRSATSGAEEVVYDRGGMVLEAASSPDGRYLAVTVPAEKPLSDQIILVDTMPVTADEEVTELTDADAHARHTGVRWLPDASALVVTTNLDRDRTGVARIDPRTGERRWLVTSDEHDLTGWLAPDGSTLLVQANVEGAARLALHDAATGAVRRDVRLPGDGWCTYPLPAPVWSPNSRFAALSYSSTATPGDALLLDSGGEVRALTDSAAQLGSARPVPPTAHRVPTPDGEQVPCFVYAPENPPPDVAGSSVLFVHGGPEAQSVQAFNPIVQALVDQGHTVLVPNVRGSTGYGKRWYSADDVRRRLSAVDDLAALHDWLPSLGLDPSRAALWGGSYGGYMVLAGLAFQPERWAAGVDIVGISSLLTFLENTAAYRRAHREREYGSLRDDADFLREASPLTRADAISAPLFVLHGANDPRVPLSEAEQLAQAVRAKGIECELLVYADEGHGLAKRVNRLDAYPRALAFLLRHLRR